MGVRRALSSNQRWPSASDTKSANQSLDLNRHDDIRQKKKQPASALKHQLASFFSSVSPILGHFPRDAQRSTWTTELQSRALPRFPHHAGTTSFRDPRQRATCGAGTAVCWSSALSSPVRIIHHSKKNPFLEAITCWLKKISKKK